MVTLRTALFADLDTWTLYALLRLRVGVFVVEQECAYQELDGRDTEPTTEHLWLAADDREPVAYLRILADPDGVARIGRVCVATTARGGGQARQLMDAALDRVGDRPCVLDAQTYLRGFYERLGFAVTGPEFLDDGVPHVPMRRATAG